MNFKKIENLDQYSGTILIPVFETTSKSLVPIEYHGVEVSSTVFYGKKDTHYLVEKYNCTHVFIGLGTNTEYKNIKTIFRRISSMLKDNFSKNVAVVVPEKLDKNHIEAMFVGLLLGTYSLGHFKKKEIHPFRKDNFALDYIANFDFADLINQSFKIAQAQLEVFRLVDLPSNVVTPKYLADWAVTTGDKHGFQTEIFGFEKCKELGLDAFVAVGKGSEHEMKFIVMNYIPENYSTKTKHIGLVGKGITFDTGGLNIKTAGMLHMKSDMAGGAAVLGAMSLVASLKMNVKVTAIVPCCENAVDSKSFLPSDVIGSYMGKTIEIIDTDAEGRLILADGLAYLVKNFNPEIIVDVATLTGSAVGTFGYECAALFTNNTQLSDDLQQAGNDVGERLWPLPLWDCYKSDIESDIADVKNYSGKPVAGAISAAKFLEFFTNDHKAWAHLDIAGVAFGDDEFAKSKHATAFGVHLIAKFIANIL